MIGSQHRVDHAPLRGVAERGLGRNSRTAGRSKGSLCRMPCSGFPPVTQVSTGTIKLGSTVRRLILFRGSCRQPNQVEVLIELAQSCGTHWQ